MQLSPRTRAWVTVVGAVVLVLLAVLVPQLGRSGSATPGAGTTVSGRATAVAVSPTVRGGEVGGSVGDTTDSPVAMTSVALSALDPQARQTLALIEAGGPFPYPRNDGVGYHNANHVLPRQPDGYYREYTVPTPGSSSRGARRIVVGGGRSFYYTRDHYETFQLVDLAR